MTTGTLRAMPQRPTEGTQSGPPPVLGLAEIGDMLGMTKATVMNLRGRAQMARRAGDRSATLFPLPDWVISGNPVWKPSTIRAWARLTGRLDSDGRAHPAPGGPKR